MKARAFGFVSVVLIPLLAASPRHAHAGVVNVTCSDTTADTTTLNKAISGSSAGDQIDIHGKCLINGTIVVYGNRSYIGDARNESAPTVIEQANNANLTAMLVSDSWYNNSSTTGDPIRIAHVQINGNSANNITGTAGLVIRSWLTVVEDVVVTQTSGDGIQITNTSQNGTALTNTQVNGRISNVFIDTVGGNGVNVVDSGNSITDWDLLDSWIANTGQSGINMANAAGWKIRGVHLYGIQQNAIYANRCYATTMDANYIEDFGDSGGSSTWYGIACTVQGDAASVISGNKVFQFNGEIGTGNYIYIGVPQVNYGTGIINIVDNVIKGANGKKDIGLSYQLSGGSGLDVLSNNNVQGVTTKRSVGSGVTLVTAQ